MRAVVLAPRAREGREGARLGAIGDGRCEETRWTRAVPGASWWLCEGNGDAELSQSTL